MNNYKYEHKAYMEYHLQNHPLQYVHHILFALSHIILIAINYNLEQLKTYHLFYQKKEQFVEKQQTIYKF